MQVYDQLLIVAGAMLGIAGLFAFGIVKGIYKTFKLRSKMKKDYQAELKKVEEFKANGGMHKWVNDVPVRLPDGKMVKTHVCEHTGFCPSINGFVPLPHIQNIIEQREGKKEFEEFKKNEVKSIQEYYSIADCDIEQLVQDVLTIELKFKNKKMTEFKEKLQKQFGKNVKIVTNMDELNQALKDVKSEESREIS